MATDKKIVVSEESFRERYSYAPETFLGEGGFAKVYRAHDGQFDETVALKFYTKTDVSKYDIISEMRHSRRFTHQNIIRVHDACIVRFTNSFGVAEDVQVGILEYADGGNLLNFLNKRPSEEQFKQVMIGILQGLHYLHTEKRVIHRDLSPDNILMVRDEGDWVPKIADFGISKQSDLTTLQLGAAHGSTELIGKMEYMAPEQFDPRKYGIDGRITTNVDLWSFGIMLTEIFTETSPFGGGATAQNPMAVVHNVLNNPLPPQISDIPEPYREVIRRCLVKDARHRAQSSTQLIDLLLTTPAPSPPPRRSFRVGGGVLVGLLVAAALGGGYYWQSSLPEEQPIVLKSTKEEDTGEPSATGSRRTSVLSGRAPAGRELEEEAALSNPARPGEASPEEADDHPTSAAANPPPSNNATAPVRQESAPPSSEELLPSLLREINSLDNQILSAGLRLSRVDRYIEQYFVSPQTPVFVHELGETTQYTIRDFFVYLVNSAETEQRGWQIASDRTLLRQAKVSELHLKKVKPEELSNVPSY